VETTPREVLVCQDDDGKEPFTDWLSSLEPPIEAIVLRRIDRVEDGNFGDVAPIGNGLSELRIDVGPGYRVYFGQIANQVHLIGGGQKKHQPADIAAAKEFWSQHGKD